MIDLVLEASRKQLAPFHLVFLAVDVHRPYDDARRPLDIAIHFRNRETAFFPFDALRIAVDDLGIEEHESLAIDIDHRQALEPTDLWRRQPDPLRRVHRLEHVIDETSQLGCHLGHDRRLLPEYGVAENTNIQQTHA